MKVLSKIVLGFSIIILMAAIAMVIFKFEVAVVTSGSMEPSIHTGSLLLIDRSKTNPKVGDVIAFKKGDGLITHRVVDKQDNLYITKGDANEDVDPGMISTNSIEGKTVFSIPYLGRLIKGIDLLGLRDIAALDFGRGLKNNSFRIGGNEVSIEENFLPPEKLYPGVEFRKCVKVKNRGFNPCYVRIMASFTDGEIARLSELDFNTKNWQYGGDGYYYYKGVLKMGEETEYLFSKVKIKEDAPGKKLKDFQINIYVESRNEESGGF